MEAPTRSSTREKLESPSPTLPKGREFFLVVFEEVEVTLFFLKKAGM